MSIRILSQIPGFRRAGVAHVADATWPNVAFSAEQLAQLKAEPKLIVLEGDDQDALDDLLAEAGRLSIEAMASLRREIAGGDANIPEGQSGTAREAPSADSGSTDAPASVSVDGAQLAAPQVLPEPAPGGPAPEEEPAKTTEAAEADPAESSDAAPPKKSRKG
jgi:hypothetical protein